MDVVFSLLSDCKRFSCEFFSDLNISCLQVYHSALHFTPRQTDLWKWYRAKRLSLGDADNSMEETWSPCLWILKNHSGSVRSVAFSPNGTQVVSGSSDSTVCLWDAMSGAHLNTFRGHSSFVWSVAFSPNGTQVVSGSDDKSLCLWDAVSGAHLNTLKGHSGSVVSVAFSPNGTQVVSGSSDKTVCLWDAMSGAHSRAILVQFLTSVAFSSDGTQVVSRSYDNTLQLWDVIGRNISSIYDTTSINAPAWLTFFSQSAPSCYHFIVVDDGWICLRNQKQHLCWIPVPCRPSDVKCLAFNETCVL